MTEFASNSNNINNPTEAELEKGFAGCGGEGMQMTSANINGALRAIAKNAQEGDGELQQQFEDLPDEEFIEVMALEGDELVASYNSTRTPLRVDLSKYLPDTATLEIIGNELVLTNTDDTESRIPLVELLNLSPDSGNLLEMRDNGIYYGIEAPPNLANIYVDAELGEDGVSLEDGGGGTDKPFKTLDRAHEVTPNNKSNVIHLKAVDSFGDRQIYDMRVAHKVAEGATRLYKAYGEQPNIPQSLIDCVMENSVYFYYMGMYEFIRPIIKPRWREYERSGAKRKALPSIYSSDNISTAQLEGVAIELTNPLENEYSPDGSRQVFQRISTILKYSEIIDEVDNEVTRFNITTSGYTPQMGFERTFVSNPRTTDNSVIGLKTGQATITVSNGNALYAGNALETCNGDLTPIESNIVEYLSATGHISDIVRDSSGTVLNLSSNFVV